MVPIPLVWEWVWIGTGSETDIGSGSGQYYTINIPLLDGITDDQYTFIFKR